MDIGITGYGVTIPRLRLSVNETWDVWQNAMLKLLKHQLFVSERVVSVSENDVVDMAVQAARHALDHSGLTSRQIEALYLGTCTNSEPFYPLVTSIADALECHGSLFCSDIQFSTKSGTSALQTAYAMVLSGCANNTLAIGSDTLNRMTAPGTIAEYSASSAAVACTIGTEGVLAEIVSTFSYATDLSDEFRIEGDRFIRSGGLQTVATSMETGFGLKHHILKAVNTLLDKEKLTIGDFDYIVFQQPFGVVPFSIGEDLHIDLSRITPGVTAYELGNCGSASVLIGLSNILDIAKPGDKILVASYGPGAGSDAIYFIVTDEIEKKRKTDNLVEDLIADKEFIDYTTAMEYENKRRIE